jgi:phosphoenolpyruvate-protein phosphotransferase (PTS system enzyme I)
MNNRDQMLIGIPASPGIAIGRAYIFNRRFDTVHQWHISADEIEKEIARFKKAVAEALEDLTVLQKRIAVDIDEEAAQIFRSHQAVIEDPEVIDVTIVRIRREHKNAESIFDDVMQGWISNYSAIQNPFFRERIADFEDIQYRVLAKLTGEAQLPIGNADQPVIIVAHNLSPSDTAEIDRKSVCGFITDVGGQTSHTAIVARGLGVPAIVGIEQATQRISDGMMVILDGNAGMIYLDPDAQTIKKHEDTKVYLSELEHKLLELHDLPAITKDGRGIELSANIELPEEVDDVLHHGADGIGLYRTEFLYLLHHGLPSEEEQFQAYRFIAESVAPKSVIVRTLDLGSDKMPANVSHEPNPALGLRGIRFCLNRPEMFKVQLRAILRASMAGNLRIMFPMISGLKELRHAKALFEESQQDLIREGIPFDRSVSVGMMIEVPSAALMAHDLAREVDFFSIGTNDLIQYTIAVDRGNANVASLYDPCHPAILRFIASIIEAGHKNDIWVGVCGAMAAHPTAACILLGLGLDELSMSPIDIPEIKRIIRSTNYVDLQAIAQHVLTLPTSDEITRYMKAHLPTAGKDLL